MLVTSPSSDGPRRLSMVSPTSPRYRRCRCAHRRRRTVGRDINSPDASCATTSTAHRPGAQHKIPALTTSPDSLEIHRAFSPGGHDLSLPPAVVVNEASDVTFPGRIAPAFKARVSPPDQSGRGKGHRLPCRVGASTRLPLRSTQIRSGSPVLTAPSKVKLPVYSVPLTCHRAFTLVVTLSSAPRTIVPS